MDRRRFVKAARFSCRVDSRDGRREAGLEAGGHGAQGAAAMQVGT